MIDEVNSINDIKTDIFDNNYPIYLVDKDLFKKLEEKSNQAEREPQPIKFKSGPGFRKQKYEVQNQNNLKGILSSENKTKISKEKVNEFINAAKVGNIDEVKRFLENGIDVNAKNIFGQTSLHLAAAYGREEIVKLLLSNENINVDATDIRGESPFLFAVKHHHIQIVKIFIDSKKANLNICTFPWKLTALHLAIEEFAPIEMLRILLAANVNPFAKDHFGKTALDRAKEYHNEEAIEILIEAMKKN